MTRAHGPWKIHDRSEPFRDGFLQLFKDRVTKPDGSEGQYATVTLKTGVAILPIEADGHVHLTQQFRYAVGHDSVEAPSGTLNDGEHPADAAKREVHEELGIEADQWAHLGCVDVDTSIVRAPVYLFVARGLRFRRSHQDPAEVIRPMKVLLDDAVKMVIEGRITHAASCVLILRAALDQRSAV